jgi:hypothetical protein
MLNALFNISGNKNKAELIHTSFNANYLGPHQNLPGKYYLPRLINLNNHAPIPHRLPVDLERGMVKLLLVCAMRAGGKRKAKTVSAFFIIVIR